MSARSLRSLGMTTPLGKRMHWNAVFCSWIHVPPHMHYLRTVFAESFRELGRNKVRSLLTVLGIAVGIAAFICVVAIGNAGSARIEQQLHDLGDNMIWVEAGSRSKGGIRVGSRRRRTLTAPLRSACSDKPW